MGMSSSSDCIVGHRRAVKTPVTTDSCYLYDILVAGRLMHEFRTAIGGISHMHTEFSWWQNGFFEQRVELLAGHFSACLLAWHTTCR